MHLPDGLVNPIILVVLWMITIVIMIIGFYRIGSSKFFAEEESDKIIPYIGVIAAVIFAFQFVNYPVPGGTSGHLVGGTLVAVILGPWASVIVLFLVLVVQALFGDGGFTVLGANAFNMGIIGGIVGILLVKGLISLLNKTSMTKEYKVAIATAIGSYIAIVLAAFICSVEITIYPLLPVPIELTFLEMIGWHLLIGIGEAIISALVVFYVYKTKPSLILTEEFLGVS